MASLVGVQRIRTNKTFHQYYECVFLTVKHEVYRVFLWVYEGGSQYVGEYIKTKKIKINLGTIEKKALERKTSPAQFDIGFLYKLLQHTCGLADSQSCIWNKPRTDQEKKSLEHSLYLLKEKRNQLSHDPEPLMNMTVEELENHLEDVSHLCEIILREAGQMAKRTSSEVDDCIAKMKKSLDDIKTNPSPSGMTGQKLAIYAKNDLKRNHKPALSSQTFFELDIESSFDGAAYRRYLQGFPLWRCDDGSPPRLIVLKGETGTGKSSVCRYIFDSWISGSTDIPELEDFDVVILIQASSVSTCDVVDFLRSLMEDTILSCNREEVIPFLQSLRILWIIDGLEESTKVATDLMNNIFSLANDSHLIFLTTQPQQDLSGIFPFFKDSLCEGNLTGLSEKGVQDLLESVLGDNVFHFFSEIQSLGNDLLMEIHNPLKMKLMVKLWEEGKLRKEAGVSVYSLYKTITETHKEKLYKILQRETKLNDADISERIQSWVDFLCQIAYDMANSNAFLKIGVGHQQQLKEKAKSLIYPEYCCSLFLQRETAENNSSYSFVHGTQQIYFAAQFVCSLIKEEGMLPDRFKRLFKRKLSLQERQSHHFLYLMLLQVVSGVAEIGDDVERHVIKDLVQLLSTMKSICNSFEVVRHANYNPYFAEEVGKFCNRQWNVFDRDIQAAVALLPFVNPVGINIDISKDPKEIHELPKLLELISTKDLLVGLTFLFHISAISTTDVSDGYLNNICSPDAKCHLIAFTGTLSMDGLTFLKEMNEVKRIQLRVSSNKVFHELLRNLTDLESLEYIGLDLFMPRVTAPPLNFFQERSIKLTISITNMEESKVKEIADAIANISHHYEYIQVTDISADSAVLFVQRLQERTVQVKEIHRILEVQPNVNAMLNVNYGVIPLTQPIDKFHNQWQNTRVEKYEDDLGVDRIRLIAPRIPRDRVEYIEGDLLGNYKLTKF